MCISMKSKGICSRDREELTEKTWSTRISSSLGKPKVVQNVWRVWREELLGQSSREQQHRTSRREQPRPWTVSGPEAGECPGGVTVMEVVARHQAVTKGSGWPASQAQSKEGNVPRIKQRGKEGGGQRGGEQF